MAVTAGEDARDARAGLIGGQDMDVEVSACDEGLVHGAGQRHVEHDVRPGPDAQGREGGDGDGSRDGVAHCFARHAGGGLGLICSVEGGDDDDWVRELRHDGRHRGAEVSGLVIRSIGSGLL